MRTILNLHNQLYRMNEHIPPSRPAARLAAVQALYQMEFTGKDWLVIYDEFVEYRLGAVIDGHQFKPADKKLFHAIIKGTVDNQLEIDPLTHQAMKESWPLDKIDSTLRAILRAATFELLKRHDVPVKVVLNEYVDIAKSFFIRDNESRFVNAVLDNIAHKVRANEIEPLSSI